MLYELYGFVSVSGGHKQFTILSDPFKYRLLRFGRFEAQLEPFAVGTFLKVLLYKKEYSDTLKLAYKYGSFSAFVPKEFQMSGSNFITILSVGSPAPKNVESVSVYFDNSQLLTKTAWFVVAETGSPYTLPTPVSLELGQAAVDYINSSSNALAAVVNDNGELVYSPGSGKKVVEKKPVVAEKKEKREAKSVVASNGKPYFYFEKDANVVLSTIAGKYRNGWTGCVNVLATGDSGTGKTTVAQRFADAMGWGCHRLNCALITEASDIAGQRGIKKGETTWEWSAVAKAITAGNCVVILDELNRAYPNALNALFGLLDDSRRTWFNDIELVVGPNVVFFATINEGSQYTGTFQADAALLNRFAYIFRMGNVPNEEAEKIIASNFPTLNTLDVQLIVKTGRILTLKVDGFNFSVRTMKNLAEAVASGMSHREAWEFVVVSRVHDGFKKDVIDYLNVSLGAYNPDNSQIKLIF